MNQKEQIAYWQRVGQNINHHRAIVWFIGINLPIAIGLSFLFGWHNGVVGEPNPMHLLMRAAVALVAFGFGGILFFRKVFQPAIQTEKNKTDQTKDD
jgi:hypothetical protein